MRATRDNRTGRWFGKYGIVPTTGKPGNMWAMPAAQKWYRNG